MTNFSRWGKKAILKIACVGVFFSYIYWTAWGNVPKIERAAMNGENRTNLVTTQLQRPNGLTIDHVYNKLYWVDAYHDDIEVMHLETLERRVVINRSK